MPNGGSNGELRYTGFPHAVTLAHGVPAASGNPERFAEPARAELPSAARTASASLHRATRDGLPGEKASAMAGR